MGTVGSHRQSLAANRAAFDGPSPHRRYHPWPGFELSPKEVAAQNRLEPVRALTSSLVASSDTESVVERIVAGEVTLDAAASAFVKRRGTLAWSTMREVLRRVADGRDVGRSYPRAVLNLTSSLVRVDAPLTADELTRGPDGHLYPRQRGLAKRNREAAAILVARGTGRCPKLTPRRTKDGVEISICHAELGDYRRGRYCLLHMPRSKSDRKQDRADREAVATLLRGVADALGV